MLRTALVILLACLLGTAAPASAAAGSGERRLALVIGNAAYESDPLINPVNDARAISTALEAVGFKTTRVENGDQRTMKQAIDSFGEQLRGGGVGLFYFSGHGLQVRGRNYLVPVGARIGGDSDVEYEAVDAGRVLGKMADAQNEVNVVILDACRNNPFTRSFRNVSKGLAMMDAPSGAIVAYATAPGDVASDNPGGGTGLYTTYLLKHLAVPGLNEEVQVDVGEGVGVQVAGGRWERKRRRALDDYLKSPPRVVTRGTAICELKLLGALKQGGPVPAGRATVTCSHENAK